MLTAHCKTEVARICDWHLEQLRFEALAYAENAHMAARRKSVHLAGTYGAAAATLTAFLAWFWKADTGAVREYYKGVISLAEQRERSQSLHCVASAMRDLALVDYVRLQQSRDPNGITSYQIVRTRKGFISPLAQAGTAGSSPSPKFNGNLPKVGEDGNFEIPARNAQETGVELPALDQYEGNERP